MNLIAAGLKRDRLAIVIIILFVAGASLIRVYYELPSLQYKFVLTNAILVTSGLFVCGLFWLGRALAIDRPDRPLAYLYTNPEVRALTRNFVQTLPLVSLLCLFLPSFSLLKSMVGYLNPYQWDPIFIQWDQMIHGQDAWMLIQPVLGYPAITFFLAMAYQLWILFLYIAFPLVCIWQGNQILRQQMIISFLLSWIVIGVIMANWLASVGPCFLEPMTGDPRFSAQTAYLAGVDKIYPLLVLDVQKELLASYLASNHGLGRGISAMPSMHVSIAFLFALFSWRLSRRLRIVAATYFILILLGSIHLGYHYAIDGYVAIVTTSAIWIASGFIARTR